MEIFHRGYFNKKLDGKKKYKVPRFNKTGGKIYLDGLDPEKISWVEMNNIAYTLGYREKPISYHFKVPKTPANMGFIQIKSDGDAIEMVNALPKKKKQISVYITGPAIDLDDVVDLDGDGDDVNGDGEEVYGAGEELNGPVKDVNRAGEEVNGSGPSQGTFAGLSDLVSDLHMGEETTFKQSSEKVAEKRERRVKHCVRRPWPPGFKDDLARELEEIRQKERGEADRREREELDELARVETELRESQAENGLSREEIETSAREAEEKKKQEEREKAVREEAEKKEREAAEKRASEAFKVRQQLADELEERLKEKKKGKQYVVGKKSKKSGYGRNPEAARYNTRNKGKKHFQPREEEDTDDSELSDWYTDSDYELEHDVFDDAEFDENVNGDLDVVPEFEEMGYEGYCSDEVCNSDGLESLAGSDTEEDEKGNPIKMPTRLGKMKLPLY
ncbi:hypothetical protein ACLB2K_002022 [Fragaria x ananassa]